MNRRAFLAMLTAAIYDPERAFWVPGKKVISIPPVGLGNPQDWLMGGVVIGGAPIESALFQRNIPETPDEIVAFIKLTWDWLDARKRLTA